MTGNNTLLCIHRDPAQLRVLQENGYELIVAANGWKGLRLLMTHPVDAIVLEYNLGLLDVVIVATEIKKVKPQLPIVMLADHLELPDGALKAVDALVTKSDGAHFLWATVHFILNVKPNLPKQAALSTEGTVRHRRLDNSRRGEDCSQKDPSRRTTKHRDAPFSPRAWRSIL